MATTSDDIRIRIRAQNDTRAAFSQVNTDLERTGRTAQATQGQVMGASGAMGDMGRKAGAAGIQIQQLVGQIQGGVSPTVALSQQAADLGFVLGFPLLGAVVGITAAIAGPMMTALFGASEQMEELKEDAKLAKDSIRQLGIELLGLSELDLARKLQNVSEELTKADAAIQRIKDAKKAGRYLYDQEEFKKELSDAEAAKQELLNMKAEYDRAFLVLGRRRAKQEKQAAEKGTALELDNLKKSIMSKYEVIERWENDQIEVIEDSIKERLISQEDGDALIEKVMQEGFTRRLELENDYLDDARELREKKARDEAKAKAKAEREAAKKKTKEDTATGKIAALMKEIASEEEQIILWQEEKLKLIDEYNELGLANDMEAWELREKVLTEAMTRELELERKKAEAVKKIREADQKHVEDTLWGNVDMMRSAYGEQSALSKALFLMNQTAAASEAIVNAELASTKALAAYPPPMNMVMATAVKASGYAAAGAIMGQALGSFEGGGYTGMGSRTGGVDGKGGFHAILHPNETVIDHTKGGGAGVNVNFTIQANDTAGFDKLLESRRGQIVSLVSKALANNGRRL